MRFALLPALLCCSRGVELLVDAPASFMRAFAMEVTVKAKMKAR